MKTALLGLLLSAAPVLALGQTPAATAAAPAAEDHLALIDLQATSKILYEAMGEGPSKAAFVHFPANTFPGQMQALKDNTHFTSYGAYEIARCVVAGIAASDLPLRQLLVADLLPFSPTRPDQLAAVAIPPSPVAVPEKPEGN